MSNTPTANGLFQKPALGDTGWKSVQDANWDAADAFFAQRNKIINGDILLDQVNDSAAVDCTNTLDYPVNRIAITSQSLTTQTVSAQRVASTLAGAAHSLKVTIGGTGAAPASAAFNTMLYTIEGSDIDDLLWGTANAKELTVCFRAKSSVSGNYGLSLRNGAADRFYTKSFALTANTDTLVSVTFPGDTAGTWLSGNGSGIQINVDLGVGANHNAAASSAWAAGNFYGLTGGVKLVATTGATFEISLLQAVKGAVCGPFHFISIEEAIRKAQRYCYVWQADDDYSLIATGFMVPDGSNAQGYLAFPVPLRSAGFTFSSTGNWGFTDDSGSHNQQAAITLAQNILGSGSSSRGARLTVATNGLPADMKGFLTAYNNSGGKLIFRAEY